MQPIHLFVSAVTLMISLSAFGTERIFEDWEGNVSADYTLTIDDRTPDRFSFHVDVNPDSEADMLAIGFDVDGPPEYDDANLDLMGGPGLSAAFDTTVCHPNQGCNFNGAVDGPFDVVVRFARQGKGVSSVDFSIARPNGLTIETFSRVGIRAQNTGPEGCSTTNSCSSDKAVSQLFTDTPDEEVMILRAILSLILDDGDS